MYTSNRALLFNPEKILELTSDLLLPREQVLGLFKTYQSVLITNLRLMGLDMINKKIDFSIPLNQISELTVVSKKEKSDSWYKNNP
ncbi:MAG: hypothetical protein F2603_03255, partial [Actinobacteria bacterium]|nr:hypothetical protein [Actinomycetota bacterium]